ncbi:MAG: 4-hydroxy-tetrahydrodipicolinate synthase [Gammaproteobacteria bacterium MedPE]|nr:MAG: 4-hydroxy-tetrahydrodipicolinate synthase [Gammaproteobacteria bacterium MedPE]
MTHQQLDVTDFTLWTALVTPFDDDGQIDFDNLSLLVDQQAAAGNGLLLVGSTGEGLALTESEQESIVRFVCNKVPATPIMVGVGGFDLTAQKNWISRCNTLPIDAYLLTAPLYAKPGPVGQTQWFRALLQATDKPCMIYNVPSRTGIELSPAALAQLLDEDNFWSIKEASGSPVKFSEFKKALPDIAIYSGDDALLPEFSLLGAAGLVSVCANVWPQATQLYVEQCLSTPQSTAFNLWRGAIETLFSVANPIPLKVLMHQLGQINSPLLRAPLTHEELTCLEAITQAHYQITQWYQSQTRSVVNS